MAQQAVYKIVQDDANKDELEGVVHVLEVDGPHIPNYLAVRIKGEKPLERTSSDIWRVPSQYGQNPNVPPDVPYWADLPFWERAKFHYKDITVEQKREIKKVWRVFKNDPLQPVRDYFSNFVITGIGLFLEGYVIFSISNNTTMFQQTYTTCWKSPYAECNLTWIQATTYLQLVGILIGQLLFGFMGDWLGRRTAMLIDMCVILIGVIMLTVSNGTSLQGWVVMYAISQLVFGIGIGGEYPGTSTRATEESEETRLSASSRPHRGRKVMLAYTMQGWGQFINLAILILLLLIFNSSGNPPFHIVKGKHTNLPYSHAAIGAVWRTTFGLLIPLVLYLIYYRIYILRELSTLGDAKARGNVTGYDWYSFRLLFTHYGHRLFGTAGIWFCNDWYFYGNGVFRSTFVSILLGSGAGILTNWLWSFLNAGIQLFGYYAAALTVDWKCWGRRRMTTFSFLMIAAIFLCCAAAFNHLTQKRHIHWFQFLYYFSSFWGLFGSHTTSFLLSAESYPAAIRGTAHGISAASGKVGSICVVVWFNYTTTNGRYWIVWPGALAGAIITYVFIADATGLDLAESERRWEFIRVGRPKDYHGVAVHRRHLSRWEVYVLGIHKQYDPVADRHQIMQAKFNGWTEAEAALKGTDGKGAFSLKGSDLKAQNLKPIPVNGVPAKADPDAAATI